MEPAAMVIIALVEPVGGRLDETAKGVLSYGARMAHQLDCPWQAAAVRELQHDELQEAGRYGLPTMTCIQQVWDFSEQPERAAHILAEFLSGWQLPLVVLPHNDLGATLAPILAARLDAALVSEVREVENGQDGLCLYQSLVETKVVKKRFWLGRCPLVLTVPPAILSGVEAVPARQCSTAMEMWEKEVHSNYPSTEVVQRIPPDPTTVDLTEAETIFCAGKGCSRENVEQLRQLCKLLGTSLGVTRPVYDQGWCDFSRMIGQTGRTVRPKLYISFGVSGSMHHVGGIKDSCRIVAINIDAKAPIFPNADEGFVADVNEVLPLMLEAAANEQGGAK